MRKTILMIFVLFLVAALPMFAQLKVTVNLSSRPDPYLSTWSTRKEVVIVTIINSGANPVRAKFDCKINQNGQLVANTKREKMQMLDIPTGVSQYYGEDLVPFENVKIKDGLDRTAVQTGMLPAGTYEFCVALLDQSDREISLPVCRNFNLQSYQAPVLLQPEDKSVIWSNQRPMFRWTPISPRPPFPFTYRIQVFEVLQGQTAINAFRVNKPILDVEGLTMTQFLWSPDYALPNPKLKHIWTVRAIDEFGNSIGEPEGYATPFIMGGCCEDDNRVPNCCPPHDITDKEGGGVNAKEKGKDSTKKDRDIKPMGQHIPEAKLRTKANVDSVKKENEGNGNPLEQQKCPDGTYPNPQSHICGTDCQPCLGCCPCTWDPKQYCDLITGNLNIRNVHPDAYKNNYVYVDGVMVPNDNIDISKGGTILMQKVHKVNSKEFVPSFLAGEEVIVTHQGKEIARSKIGPNGEYSFKIPAGIKSIEELEVNEPNERKVYTVKELCKIMMDERKYRENHKDISSVGFINNFGVQPTRYINDIIHMWKCDYWMAFISNPNLPDVLNDFPVTTLPKFDKDQIRITQNEPFTWNTPEVIGALGYESLTFPPGEYIVKIDPKTKTQFVELTTASAKKLTNPNSLSSAKMAPMCHMMDSRNCKNIGVGCLVLFPEPTNPETGGWKVSIVNEKDGQVTVRLDGAKSSKTTGHVCGYCKKWVQDYPDQPNGGHNPCPLKPDFKLEPNKKNFTFADFKIFSEYISLKLKDTKEPTILNESQPQSILTGGWCGCYINGAKKALAFRLQEGEDCAAACKWLNRVFDKHPEYFDGVFNVKRDDVNQDDSDPSDPNTSQPQMSTQATPVRGKAVKAGSNPTNRNTPECPYCGYPLGTNPVGHDTVECGNDYREKLEKDKKPNMLYTNPDGTLKYFKFSEDYVVTDKKVCDAFGVKQLVFKAGTYNVLYPDPKKGGVVTLMLKDPIPANQIKIKSHLTVEGTNPKGKNCEGPGNNCFFYRDTIGSDRKSPRDSCIFTLTPIMTDTMCIGVQVNFRGVGSPKSAGF